MPERRPIVTIGMPVFNSADSIGQTLKSIQAQTWQGPFEVLVIDDGSTDETPRILAQAAAKDPRIRIVTHSENLGRPAGRNSVLREARGEFLTWIDADDTWHPAKLERQLAALVTYSGPASRAIAICAFRVKWDRHSRGRVHRPTLDGHDLKRVLNATIPAYLWTMMCRTDLMRSVGGFDPHLPRLQDLDMVLRMLRHGCYFVPTDHNGPLCYYHKSDAGKSGRVVHGSMQRIWRKHRTLYHLFGSQFVHECRHMHFRLAARHAMANLELFGTARYFAGALSHRPLRASSEILNDLRRLPRLPAKIARMWA